MATFRVSRFDQHSNGKNIVHEEADQVLQTGVLSVCYKRLAKAMRLMAFGAIPRDGQRTAISEAKCKGHLVSIALCPAQI
ncbi:hypothetical protein E2C01_030350 [Portunus trituberculatus]|uniref:Uncharacterized protein n=1 Tax=Portunus trituberculatus TaxID=210409 RepID=A0A5B7EQM1_PORTR|nr:hypothetical protein [Portunus trituberculatus]